MPQLKLNPVQEIMQRFAERVDKANMLLGHKELTALNTIRKYAEMVPISEELTVETTIDQN